MPGRLIVMEVGGDPVSAKLHGGADPDGQGVVGEGMIAIPPGYPVSTFIAP
jgi:hypothetical protein